MTGSIVTFDDAIPFMPIEKLVATIEPQQDLHGQDAPYPAGGGVNICALNDFTKTKRDVTFAYANGKLIVNGTPSSAGWFGIGESLKLPAGSYTVSYKVSGSNPVIKIGFDNFGGYLQFNTAGTLSRTFTLSEEKTGTLDLSCDQTTAYANTEILIQIESGSTASAWTPYENICPITGWTGLEGQRTGKNLLDPQYNVITSNNIKPYQNNGFVLKANETYTFSVSELASGLYISKFGTNDSIARIYNNTSLSYTPTEDIVVYFNAYYATVPEGGLEQVKFMLELGSTATTYEEYTGEEISVTFPDEAGTVYGGTLDVVSGLLTVNRVKCVLGGGNLTSINNWFTADVNNQSWGAYLNSGNDIKQIITEDIVGASFISDQIKDVGGSYGNRAAGTGGITRTSAGVFQYFGIRIAKEVLPSVSSSDELKIAEVAYLNANPIELVFDIAPKTYQLTPQQVSTLIGKNNIWVDTGDVSVTYQSTSGSTPVRTSFKSPLKNYSYSALKLFNNTFIEHGKG